MERKARRELARERERERYIYIYIFAVELKAGPRFALLCVKIDPSFWFLKISLSLQKEEDFSKNKTNSSVKNWSNYVAQHTWTSFLTQAWTSF